MKTRKTLKGARSYKSVSVDPSTLPQPASVEEFLVRGMSFYARKDYVKAAEDFNKAIQMEPSNKDAYYGLGMVYKAATKKEEAVQAFQQVIAILAANPTEAHDRREMLRRLALGHINELNSGDWNLEKEIWKRIP